MDLYGPQIGGGKRDRLETPPVLRRMEHDDWTEVADLIYVSHNYWCVSNGFPEFFTAGPEQTLTFCRIYEDLDPGCCVVVEHAETGRLMGACFFRERDTHFALGIMSVHPNYANRRVGRAMVEHICRAAHLAGKPTRLLSPATNLDAFSLYTRAGFTTIHLYQDMLVPVPERGIGTDVPLTERVRDAALEDVDAIAAIELDVSGVSRTRDYRYFIENRSGDWHMSVIEEGDGTIGGFLASLGHPHFNMIGPGVARTEDQTVALLVRELNVNAGRTPILLLPVDRPRLVALAYGWGARNFDLTLSQVDGDFQPLHGVNIPSFLPESA